VQPGIASEDEISAWASQLVETALAEHGSQQSAHNRMVLEQMYAAHLALARGLADDDRQVLLTFCLAPGGDLMPVVTVNLSAVSLYTDMPEGAVVDLLVLPEEQRHAPPDADELETGAGVCTKVRQLVLPPAAEGGDADLVTSLLYLWPTVDDGIYLLLDAYFTSPAEAVVFEPDIDALAVSLTVRAAA
jgi:hypothetical protein